MANIRLWNPVILRQTYEAVQRIQRYYEFSDVDVDRYTIQGQERMVMLSAREVSQTGIPGVRTWQNVHLTYTHGYGAVASTVNTATSSGAPDFVLQDIPPAPGAQIPLDPSTGAQVYYGERADIPYVVSDSNQKELNYPNPGGQTVFTQYHGKGGISVGGFFRRLAFAYRYRDFNLLISNLIGSDSKIMINRDIKTRIQKAAPFLKYDADPYAAIVGGHLFYIWDAYTTTDLYPYSQRVGLSSVTNRDLSGRINYIRNSVKAVVNAYDGSVRFYVVDPTDPLIQVSRRARGPLPLSGGPPADAGVRVRPVPRNRHADVLQQRRAVGRAVGPSCRRGCELGGQRDAPPVLRPAEAPWNDRRAVRAVPAVHAVRPAEPDDRLHDRGLGW